MGKRGPKKGQGGRPKTKTDAFSKLQRLRMQKSRALKYGQLEIANQIQKRIENFRAEQEKRQHELLTLQDENKFLKVQVTIKKPTPEEMGVALSNVVTINGAPMEGQEIKINYGDQKDWRNKK